MAWLPERDEQEWILDCLGLIARRFGVAPLERGSAAPRAVIARLGAGEVALAAHEVLGWLPVPKRRVEVVGDGLPAEPKSGFARVIFADEESLTLAIRPRAAVDPARRGADLVRVLVGQLRIDRGYATSDRRREGRLVDLTAVWLGLGAMLANGADPMLFARDEQLPPAGGRLSTQAVSFALAARVIARESSCFATWRLGSHLDRVPRRCFTESLRQLRQPRGAVAERLRLPGHAAVSPARLSRRPGSASVSADEPE